MDRADCGKKTNAQAYNILVEETEGKRQFVRRKCRRVLILQIDLCLQCEKSTHNLRLQVLTTAVRR